LSNEDVVNLSSPTSCEAEYPGGGATEEATEEEDELVDELLEAIASFAEPEAAVPAGSVTL
jgi:hypothetical protein